MRRSIPVLAVALLAGCFTGCLAVRHPHDEGWLASNAIEVKFKVKRIGSHTHEGTTWFMVTPTDGSDAGYTGKAQGTERFGFHDRERLDNFIEIDLDNGMLPFIREGDEVELRVVGSKIVRTRRVINER